MKLKSISDPIIKLFILLKVLILLIAPFLVFTCNSKGTIEDSVNVLVTQDALKNLTIALELYRKESGRYPKSLEELLIKKGISERSIIEDAWKQPYYYLKTEGSYTLFSLGRDGKPFTRDDVKPPKHGEPEDKSSEKI